jgi:hypothetical protein
VVGDGTCRKFVVREENFGFLVGCLGVEPRKFGIALAEDVCDLKRKPLWLRASMFGGGRPCPFFNYTLVFAFR